MMEKTFNTTLTALFEQYWFVIFSAIIVVSIGTWYCYNIYKDFKRGSY
ncbi:hypothetical protein [Emticicia sp. W12TSBA100-4]